MASETFRCWVCPAAIRTVGEVKVEKPGALAVTVYWPAARPEMAYCPLASDVPVVLTPEADVTVMDAWGMTAPLGSATWPRKLPVAVCAQADGEGDSPEKKKNVRQRASNRCKR